MPIHPYIFEIELSGKSGRNELNCLDFQKKPINWMIQNFFLLRFISNYCEIIQWPFSSHSHSFSFALFLASEFRNTELAVRSLIFVYRAKWMEKKWITARPIHNNDKLWFFSCHKLHIYEVLCRHFWDDKLYVPKSHAAVKRRTPLAF